MSIQIETILPSEGFVRLRTVLSVYPVSTAGWYKGMKEGRYPRPVKLGPKCSAWRVQDIRKLIESGEAQ